MNRLQPELEASKVDAKPHSPIAALSTSTEKLSPAISKVKHKHRKNYLNLGRNNILENYLYTQYKVFQRKKNYFQTHFPLKF